jgi:hypothetical protein
VAQADAARAAASAQINQLASEAASAASAADLAFLPPAYREAVTSALGTVAAMGAAGAGEDFLPAAYREAVSEAQAVSQAQAAGAQAAADSPLPPATGLRRRGEAERRDDCRLLLAEKYAVAPEAVGLASLTAAELRLVADSAAGYDQLGVIEAAMKARCHLGIWCDVTGARPIRGTRYTRPGAGDSYDLCEAAWRALPAGEQEAFRKLERPDLRGLLRVTTAALGESAASEPPVDGVAVPVGIVDDSPGGGLDAAPVDGLPVEEVPATGIIDACGDLLTFPVDTVDVSTPAEVAAADPSLAPQLAAVSSSCEHVPEALQPAVRRLLDMGYEDADTLAAVVAAHDGDFRSSVMALLAMEDAAC